MTEWKSWEDGWFIQQQGAFVVIWNGKQGDAARRHGVKVPAGAGDTFAAAAPTLRKWAGLVAA